MKKIAVIAALTALMGATAANAWWGGGPWGGGYPGYGGGNWFDDWMGDGWGDFNMNMSGGGHGRGWNRYNNYYGYGPYGWGGGPWGWGGYPGGWGGGYPGGWGGYGYPYAAPVAPQAPAAESK
jgi:hypothetical protein